MSVQVHAIELAVPPTVLRQDDARALFGAVPGISRLAGRLVGAAFENSGIETRHTVIPEFVGRPDAAGPAAQEPVFVDAAGGRILRPSTGVRNAVYAEQAPPLLVDAARRALDASGFTAADVTHVVTVSCTGFYAPGPEYEVVRGLGLSPSTARFHLGFMGCFGAFPALRMAHGFCTALPEAVVLVVCVELCTLHVQASEDPEQIVASSVFADGAAAAVVSARTPGATASGSSLSLDAFETVLTPTGEDEMAWRIGDHGFEMRLSSAVPGLVGTHIREALQPLLGRDVVESGTGIDAWAVHPGGRSILDRVETALGLDEAAMAPSREVLRGYGNMSSATVLFILRALLHDTDLGDGSRVCAMAFGPGITVESALLTKSVQGTPAR